MSLTESSHSPAKNRTSPATTNAENQTRDLPTRGILTTGASPEGHKKKVMAFGTFDLFHPGHVYYLSQAETLGDSLTVVIARDARVKQVKKVAPHDDECTRQRNVAYAFRQAEVILGDEEDIMVPLHTCAPDVLAFGYDQIVPEDRIRELFPAIEIVRIGGYETKKWKSSILREAKKSENTL